MEQAIFETYAHKLLQRIGKLKYGKVYSFSANIDNQRWKIDLGVRPKYDRSAHVYAYACTGCGKKSYTLSIPLNELYVRNKTYVFSPSEVNVG
jgi:hypothetical protein